MVIYEIFILNSGLHKIYFKRGSKLGFFLPPKGLRKKSPLSPETSVLLYELGDNSQSTIRNYFSKNIEITEMSCVFAKKILFSCTYIVQFKLIIISWLIKKFNYQSIVLDFVGGVQFSRLVLKSEGEKTQSRLNQTK